MLKPVSLLFLTLAFIVPLNVTSADDAKELRKQRQAAQKKRQAAKNERAREISEATKIFREFTRDLKNEYQLILKDLDTEFELRSVELQAEKDANIATAEAEFQKKWSTLFLRPEGNMSEEILKDIEKEGKAYADELFRIKKEAAEGLHKERMANEKKKHDLLDERDKKALDEAASLGLTKDFQPILATPIGGELTRQEEQWNQRENKEVVKLKERNLRTLKEFRNGEKLRAWERKNLEEDFKLKWDEKEEVHKLNIEQTFYNTLLLQSSQGTETNQQDIMAKFAEINKQNQLIKIKYRKIRQQNSIKRREEKKKILGQ
ncbi:MAG: hypothetical protein JSU59_01160 [Nitrospirota bacterium]|nr:MAG: hypothetical protein JSU59_01160 [Nitrospirota bacterium]